MLSTRVKQREIAGSAAMAVDCACASVRPVARSSDTMVPGSVGDAPRKTTRSPSARTDEISVYGVSIAVSAPDARSTTASLPSPFWMYEHTSRPGPANAYVYIPKTHCGSPNSASLGASGWIPPDATSHRYRFHQPLRSDTKTSDRPSGDHSGWNTDSSAPPATGAPSTYSVVPSHGIFGWSQARYA